MSETVLVVSSRALILACERMGIDTGALLQAVGIARSALDDPDGRLPLEQVRALWTRAHELSGDPLLALHAAEHLPSGAYKVIDLMALCAPTVGQGIAQVSRHFALINPAVRLPIEEGAREIAVGIEAPRSPEMLTRPYVEYTFAAVLLRNRAAAGFELNPSRVEFSHAVPPDTTEHRRIFGCRVLFQRTTSRLVFDRAVWERPRATGDATLLSLLEQHAATLVRDRQPFDQLGQIKSAIAADLCGGDVSVERAARKLGMSPRTLQRRLRQAHTTFSALLDEMRAGAARNYLSHPELSISEVAYLLGFSDLSAFNRACKRWLGCSPREFRKTCLERSG